MQNQLDNGRILYAEYTDTSGLIVREIYGSLSPWLSYQVGRHESLPMRVPVYDATGRVSHHRMGDDIQTFAMYGYGCTKAQALDRASNNLLRSDIAKSKPAAMAKMDA